MEKSYKQLKLACYTTNIAMSVVANLSPILFLTFHNLYGISYSLLGSLVLINFITQLGIDLIFSFFSHKFNIPKVVKITPLLTVVGLVSYAVLPMVFPQNAYLGLVIGTLIFSASGGFAEVLISPTIAAIPSPDPDKELSKLHSVYAWGVVPVIIISTLYILIFGEQNWQWLALGFAVVPLISFFLFMKSDIPPMETPEKVSGVLKMLRNKGLWLMVAAIFLGGAAECVMAQWSSGYIEQALGIPKILGDVFGVALFSVMLGLGRTLYTKKGKKIGNVLFLGAVGATICYLVAAITDIALLGLVACAFTGLCVSMLWPGSLIVASDRFPTGGVFIFAMMAAGGDLGAAAGPQLIGVITDFVIENPTFVSLANDFSMAPEQLGMKAGMLAGMLFPLLAIPVYLAIKKNRKETFRK